MVTEVSQQENVMEDEPKVVERRVNNGNSQQGGGKGKKFKKFLNRKQRKEHDERRGPNPDARGNGGHKAYVSIVKENAAFEAFYRMQKLIDTEEEYARFFTILRESLPSAFRISSFCSGQTEMMCQMLEGNLIKGMYREEKNIEVEVDGDQCKNSQNLKLPEDFAIAPMPWYPNKLAWTFNVSKVEIRKTPILAKLHRFLVSETATGDISRQEAVSMIPPLLLDIQPGHTVLDMCAAPGSKTAQLIEALHRHSNDAFLLDDSGRPHSPPELDGLVVANDVDNRRCYMLVHQSKRLNSPSVVIVNHDASQMPNFYRNESDGRRVRLKFDRILADVPCSGDGTIRKNYDVWTKWNAANSNNFHHLQLKIAKRGLELLKGGGLMAYSTCSLNPTEDEAVIAELLRWSQGNLELVDAASLLPGLISRPGLETWVAMSKQKIVYNSHEEVPENLQSQMRRSLFPPTAEEVGQMNLKYCVRVLPHYQNTGGFFIAVLRKKADRFPWEKLKEEPIAPATATHVTTSGDVDEMNEKKVVVVEKKQNRGGGGFRAFKEDPFFFFSQDNEDWLSVKKFYKLPDTVSHAQLAHRASTGKSRNLYFFTKAAANFVASNEPSIKLITGGARIFARIEVNVVKCPFRLTQEGVASLCPYIMGNLDQYDPKPAASQEEVLSEADTFQMVELDVDHFTRLLIEDDVKIESFEEKIRTHIQTLAHGIILAYIRLPRPRGGQFLLPICAWKGKNTVRAYVAKNDRSHLLRLCGREPEEVSSAAPVVVEDGNAEASNVQEGRGEKRKRESNEEETLVVERVDESIKQSKV